MSHVLITGGAGFVGTNAAARLLHQKRRVRILDDLSRPGVEQNLAWLRARHPKRVAFMRADIRDADAVAEATRDAQTVFHFAAQVAVTSSVIDPRTDLEVNLLGTFNLLDAVRQRPVPLLFASTNKVYGELDGISLRRTAEGWQPDQPALAAHSRHGWRTDQPRSLVVVL